MTDRFPNVEGYCPMGCGRTLFVGEGGFITCSFVECPRPDSVPDLLADSETQHVVVFDDRAFTVRHPLRERLDDALMSCDLHRLCADLPGPPPQLGRYRVTRKSDGAWGFALMDEVPPGSAVAS